MRVSILTLFFITTKYTLIIRGKCDRCKAPVQVANTKPVGNFPTTLQSKFRMECVNNYVRKAGTSNLFRCVNTSGTERYSWNNMPPLECIPNPSKPAAMTVAHTSSHTSAAPLTASSSTPAVKTFHTATETRTRKNTSTTPGQIGFTTTHIVDTTTGTPFYSTVRTTTKEEEPMTTANRTVLSSPSTLTDRQYLTTESSEFSDSISSTIAEYNEIAYESTSISGIAAGSVLILVAGVAATVALVLWRRQRRATSSQGVEMIVLSPGTDYQLLIPPSGMISSPTDSSQEQPIHSDCAHST